jgi:Mitochondrial ribosomal protein S25
MLRNNPFTLLHNITKSRSSKKPSNPPNWISALSLHPPAPRALTSCDPHETGAFLPKDYMQLLSETRIKESKHSVGAPKKARVFRKPFAIVYDEDEMRETFYRTHVAELARPFCAVEEDVETMSGEWKDSRPLSGESYLLFCLC